MENNENNKLEISNSIRHSLHIASSWSNFIAIVGFVVFGLIALIFLMSLRNLEYMFDYPPLFFMFSVQIVMLILYFKVSNYLYKFSVKIKSFLLRDSNVDFAVAVESLSSYMKLIGILLIVGISLMILSVVMSGGFLYGGGPFY